MLELLSVMSGRLTQNVLECCSADLNCL